jgi:hypothetical protein
MLDPLERDQRLEHLGDRLTALGVLNAGYCQPNTNILEQMFLCVKQS